MQYKKMADQNLSGKRVLIRQDLNVPINESVISNDARIKASLETISQALSVNAKVMLMSHLGRPTEGLYEEQYSLKPVSERLQKLLNHPVRLERNWLDGVEMGAGEIVLCENVRFNQGEKSNDQALAKRMANLCDVFVMDAFGTAHRAQASTHGVAQHATIACAGPLLCKELDALSQALENPVKPIVAIVGGSKVSTKLTVLDSLSDKVDQLIVGGGIANTFIAATGQDVGKSLCEVDLIEQTKVLIKKTEASGGAIPIPQDVVCGTHFSESSPAVEKASNNIEAGDMIFDIGSETAQLYEEIISSAGTVVWNGPVGVFEFDQFGNGTKAIAEAVANSDAFSIAGGGDTVAAIEKYQVADKVSYISTGGGAFLEFLEGKQLPAVDILCRRFEA